MLDAATGAELALTDLLDDVLSPLPEATAAAVRGRVRMLGGLLEFLETAGWLPDGLARKDIDTDLVRVRNRAAHKGQAPTYTEANTAVECAARIVSALVPLP
ncbi:hypothetical protein R8Z50_22070 [Longispora sp. K20-0274]|uniref:hypothetical protein n=1 Tax=Longispora sp. K20-0274 TaxID=3088255 RepID=UPI00399B7778